MRYLIIKTLLVLTVLNGFSAEKQTSKIDLSKAETKDPSHITIPVDTTGNKSFVFEFESSINCQNMTGKSFTVGLVSDKVKGRKINCTFSAHPNKRIQTSTLSAEVVYFAFMGKNREKTKPDVPVDLKTNSKKELKSSELIGKSIHWTLKYSAKLRSYRIVLKSESKEIFDSGWKRLYQEEMAFNKIYLSCPSGKKKTSKIAPDPADANKLKIDYNKKDSISISNLSLRKTDEF